MSNSLSRPISTTPAARSQATTIEQTRAIADVQAAAQMARTFPRDQTAATQEMQKSCAQFELADRAFFKFPKSGQSIVGPSIALARELARCWGHVVYGVKELHRGEGESEMLAFAWDLQTNTRSETAFIVEHRRSGKNKSLLDDVRDIYENNANMGARRVREMIFAVLPAWFVDQAVATCRGTLAKGDGEKPLPQRIADMLGVFENLGVSKTRLEARIGSPSSEWTTSDLADMVIVYNSLREGTTTTDDEFPRTPRVTAETLTGIDTETGEAR